MFRNTPGAFRADFPHTHFETRGQTKTYLFLRQARPYFADDVDYDDEALAKHWKDADETAARMRALRDRFAAVPDADWNPEGLEPVLRALADELGTSAAKLIHPARVAVVGMAVSPSIFQVLTALGKERTLQRLGEAVERIPGLQVTGDR